MDIIEAHEHSSYHLEAVMESETCGCFCCCRIYSPTEIYEWCDGGQTALCPKCGIDSVLPDKLVSFDKEFLKKMEQHWFQISKGNKP